MKKYVKKEYKDDQSINEYLWTDNPIDELTIKVYEKMDKKNKPYNSYLIKISDNCTIFGNSYNLKTDEKTGITTLNLRETLNVCFSKYDDDLKEFVRTVKKTFPAIQLIAMIEKNPDDYYFTVKKRE